MGLRLISARFFAKGTTQQQVVIWKATPAVAETHTQGRNANVVKRAKGERGKQVKADLSLLTKKRVVENHEAKESLRC